MKETQVLITPEMYCVREEVKSSVGQGSCVNHRVRNLRLHPGSQTVKLIHAAWMVSASSPRGLVYLSEVEKPVLVSIVTGVSLHVE